MASAKFLIGESDSKEDLAVIIRRVANMDQMALAEFYERTSPLVYGLVRRIMNNPSVAEEVTLDVYLQVWRQADRYSDSRGSPMTWLIMMARSRAIDSLRSRNKETLEQPLNPAAQFVDRTPNAEENLAAQDRQHIVRSALNALTPVHREAIELAFYSGLTHTAIAEKLGQPLGTVKSWIRTGMIQMREHLHVQGKRL